MLKSGERIPPNKLASWFINSVDSSSGEAMTHLKLQKLLYFTQAWYLANFDRPIFDEDMQAWTHGPVVPSIYDKYKANRWGVLDIEKSVNLPDDLIPFLSELNRVYGQYSAKKLEEITHLEDPWKVTRGDIPLEARCTNPIDKLTIRNYYAKRLGKQEISQLSH